MPTAGFTPGGTPEQDATARLIEAIMRMSGQQGLGQVTPFQQDILGRTSELYQNPLGSGIFQALLQPVLAALRPSEQAQRQSLTDRFRSAGQTGSGAFAQAARQQESDIFNQRGQVTSNLAQNSLQQLLGALQGGFQMGETQRRQSLVQPDLLLRALAGISPIAQRTADTLNQASRFGSIAGSGFGGPSSADITSQFSSFSPTSQAVQQANLANPYSAFGPSFSDFYAANPDQAAGSGITYGFPASDPRSSYYSPSFNQPTIDPWAIFASPDVSSDSPFYGQTADVSFF